MGFRGVTAFAVLFLSILILPEAQKSFAYPQQSSAYPDDLTLKELERFDLNLITTLPLDRRHELTQFYFRDERIVRYAFVLQDRKIFTLAEHDRIIPSQPSCRLILMRYERPNPEANYDLNLLSTLARVQVASEQKPGAVLVDFEDWARRGGGLTDGATFMRQLFCQSGKLKEAVKIRHLKSVFGAQNVFVPRDPRG